MMSLQGEMPSVKWPEGEQKSRFVFGLAFLQNCPPGNSCAGSSLGGGPRTKGFPPTDSPYKPRNVNKSTAACQVSTSSNAPQEQIE